MSGGSQTNVHLSSLLAQAKVWDEQSQAMGNIAQTAESTLMTTSGWPFSSAITAYNQVCKEISTWCGQGQKQMLQITDALCVAAKNYGATEEQLSQASDGVFH
jgi:hypothetical protein